MERRADMAATAKARTRTAKARNRRRTKPGEVKSRQLPDPNPCRFALAFVAELNGPLFENLLDIPWGVCACTLDEQTYDDDEPFLMTREAAFKLAAQHNANAKPAGECGYWLWHVVVEVTNRTKWTSITLDECGRGTMDAHDIPIRIVRPTPEEEREIGWQVKGGAL